MKRLIVGLFLVLATSVAFALPTVQQVEAETRAGNYTHAESMMSEVVAAKPGSAKAHYIYAELLAHNGNFAKASEEAAKARQIDPALSFTEPEKFRTFEQTLQRALNPPARPKTPAAPTQTTTVAPTQAVAPAPAARSGIPGWVWPVGLAVVAFFLWKAFARRREAGSFGPSANPGVSPMGYPPSSQPPGGGAPYGGPGGAPYGGPGVAPRAGSGMLGTGLAVAGGVAGGMLLDQMLNRHSEGGGAAAGAAGGALGGLVPDSYAATPPDSAVSDLENRSVDFGSGGDWDSGGGSIDSGGGGSWD